MRTLILVVLLAFLPVSVSAQTSARVAVIVVDFTNSVAPGPSTMQWAREDLANADAYVSEVSYGQSTQQSDVFGIYRVALDNTATTFQIAQAAQAAAIANSVDLTPYTMFFYVSPGAELPGHGFTSAGAVFYQSPFLDRVISPGWQIAAHELGHALQGWQNHEHASVCSDGPQEGSCVVWEYGSTVGLMAYPQGQGHVGAPFKIYRGWLTPTTITTSGDYLLPPYETSPSAFVVTGGSRQWPLTFTLEYRTATGFDSYFPFAEEANVFNGVIVHRMEPLNKQSYLLRMNPGTSGRVDVPALEVGQTWCEAGRKLSVRVLSVSPAGALVRVRYGACR